MQTGEESMSEGRGKALLKRLLSERNQYPDRVAEVDACLKRTFERTVAILALDMCGFSRLTIRYGIMHYLAMIAQMEEAARPAVVGNGGTVIKQEADNLYAIFPTPQLALEGALDIFRAFEAVNAVVPDERDIQGSIGIGYGPTLVIGEEDLFGEEMNFACKLGEDLAGAGEILLTGPAYQALPPGLYQFRPAKFEISGFCLEAKVFEKKLFVDDED